MFILATCLLKFMFHVICYIDLISIKLDGIKKFFKKIITYVDSLLIFIFILYMMQQNILFYRIFNIICINQNE